APFPHVQPCILSDPGFSPRAQTTANQAHKWPARSSCHRCVPVQTCLSQKCESHRAFRSASKQLPASPSPFLRDLLAAILSPGAHWPAKYQLPNTKYRLTPSDVRELLRILSFI